ncbi:hypothetical protein F4861DRAFT_191989 [Xylaria intraflava]|nr:hypothetical protein F4861DRAFT_191989 [Xylaria intraflava]
MPTSSSFTMYKRGADLSGHDKLVIILTIIFGIVGISLIVFGALQCRRIQRRRGLFNRGLTPIGDDEIATWKVSRADQKTGGYPERPGHSSKDSTSSAKIQYQKGGSRPSVDVAMSPRSFISGSNNHGFSIDLPRVPEAAAFARAPNARAGLTDETIPGADPFVAPLKRQPSRLQKSVPSTPKTLSRGNSRTRGSRSNSQPERWASSAESSPVGSRDSTTRAHSRMYSFSSVPMHNYPGYDKEICTELSPPPSRRRDAAGKTLD